LEDRCLPGSLLWSGLDLGGLTAVALQAGPAEAPAPARRLTDANLSVVPRAANHLEEAAGTAGPAAPKGAGSYSASLPDAGTPAASRPAAIPALAASAGRAGAEGVAAASAARDHSGQDGRPDFIARTPTRLSVAPQVRGGVRLPQAAPLQSEFHPCRPAGTKDFTPVFNSYTDSGDTSGNVAVLAVATSKAPIGFGYAAGYLGNNGTIQRYTSAGACSGMVTISGGASPVKVTSVVENGNGVYVVDATDDNKTSEVRHYSADLSALLGSVSFNAPTGGSLRLNGIGLSPNGQKPYAYVTGLIQDPNGTSTYLNTLVMGFLPDLSAQLAGSPVIIDFGAESLGTAITADRPGNMYVAVHANDVADALGDTPVQFRLDANFVTVPWAVAWTGDGTFNPFDATSKVGIGGVTVIGGTTSAHGVYFAQTMAYQASGGTSVGAYQGIWDALNVADGTVLNGGIAAEWVVAGSAGDLISTSNAADRNGQMYIGAARSETSDITGPHDGRVYKEDIQNGAPDYQQNYTGNGDDGTNGVALTTSSTTGNQVFYGGYTTSSTIDPPPSGCDTTYNSAKDGFMAASAQ
jgi:hypothetical protein